MSRDWTKNDVYLLEAVGVAEFRGESDLASVIETADSIVHEVLSREEIEQSVARLISANLIEVDGSRVFSLTSKAKFLIKESPTRNSVERIRWMQPALKNENRVRRRPRTVATGRLGLRRRAGTKR
jgi:hypothetical protein